MIACLDLVPMREPWCSGHTVSWAWELAGAAAGGTGSAGRRGDEFKTRPPRSLAGVSRPSTSKGRSMMRYPPWRARDQPDCSSPVAISDTGAAGWAGGFRDAGMGPRRSRRN